ncbi:hypothetical protein [Cyanobium sp. ATX 6F1]|nr:hypothetical protein [Cyanobium sp. ATX 6F1]
MIAIEVDADGFGGTGSCVIDEREHFAAALAASWIEVEHQRSSRR